MHLTPQVRIKDGLDVSQILESRYFHQLDLSLDAKVSGVSVVMMAETYPKTICIRHFNVAQH